MTEENSGLGCPASARRNFNIPFAVCDRAASVPPPPPHSNMYLWDETQSEFFLILGCGYDLLDGAHQSAINVSQGGGLGRHAAQSFIFESICCVL